MAGHHPVDLEELDRSILAIVGDFPPEPSWAQRNVRTLGLVIALPLALTIGAIVVGSHGMDDGLGAVDRPVIAPPTALAPAAPPAAIPVPQPAPGAGISASAPAAAGEQLATIETKELPPSSVALSRGGERSFGRDRPRQYPNRPVVPRIARAAPEVRAPAEPPARVEVANAAPAPIRPSAATLRQRMPDERHRSAMEQYQKDLAESRAAMAAYDSDRSAYQKELVQTQQVHQAYDRQNRNE